MSEESVTTSNKFNYECTLKVEKQNQWFSSDYFNFQQCPNLKFNISALRNDSEVFEIKVTKVDSKPVTAVIELTLESMTPIRKDVTDWVDNVIFNNLLVPYCHYQPFRKIVNSDGTFTEIKCYPYRVRIKCSIIWFGFTDDLLSARINKNLKTCFKNSEFSDVKIRTKNNEEFPAHKIILISNSPVFHKMLTTDMKESKENCINLPELSSDIVNELLYFLYHGKLDKAGDDNAILLKLVEVADMYCVADLKRVCDAMLGNNLSTENVLSLLESSRLHNLHILKQRALTFIVNNVNSLYP